MTPKFIERHCKNCEFRIWDPFGNSWMPEQCGTITDDGDGLIYGILEKMTIPEYRKGFKK